MQQKGIVYMYQKIEKGFNVIYPDTDKATYTSLLNFSDDLNKPFQRWYRYKEGFSIDLVKKLINDYNSNSKGIILDPFLGSGSTLIGAYECQLNGIGFEVNPFSFFLAKCKLLEYEDCHIIEFKKAYTNILSRINNQLPYEMPSLSISGKVFNKEVEKSFMTIKSLIDLTSYKYPETKDLLLLGWLSCIEALSNYRKAGNGLKIRKYVTPRDKTKKDVFEMLNMEYSNIYADISFKKRKTTMKIYNESSTHMRHYIEDNSISGIIFSPPYANCFDYTEIYKLELWFGGFVNNYRDLSILRSKSIRSHLNGVVKYEDDIDYKLEVFVDDLLHELESKILWDKRIPIMLNLYFYDMFKVLDNCYHVLEKRGFCDIVVGNSAYGGVIIPTDLILASYAQRIGFVVDKIEVDRFIITSSQQYEITKQDKKYLRESLICLIKP
jgi:DNA modification methylase